MDGFKNATNTNIAVVKQTLLGIEAIYAVTTIRFANPFTFINIKSIINCGLVEKEN